MVVARKQQLEDMVTGNDDEPLTGRNSKGWKAWRDRRNAAAELIISRLDDAQLVHIRGLEGDPAGMWVRLATVHGEGPGIGGSIDLWRNFTTLRIPMTLCQCLLTWAAFVLSQRSWSVSTVTNPQTTRLLPVCFHLFRHHTLDFGPY